MVYVVLIGDKYESEVVGIFSTEEKANEYFNSVLNGNGFVQKWELDKGEEL